MIVVTGAAGFIGSCLIRKLNDEGFHAVVAVDRFGNTEKEKNLEHKRIWERVERDDFFQWFEDNQKEIEFIFHLGARTDTTEFDLSLLRRLNTDYSLRVWNLCVKYQVPLIYASSAATYGSGDLGYHDRHDVIPELTPLNPYGISKNEFDQYVIKQEKTPFFWAGLKFFNVYGPNEYHKGRMASVIFHAFNQIQQHGSMKLFQSHHPDFQDGEQRRDFIYIKDVNDVCYYLMHERRHSGIYNLGTGRARTFLDLTNAVFNALNLASDIKFIPTPEDIRDKYQYFTEADMGKLRSIGYQQPFVELEGGITDYVQNYLKPGGYL